MKIDQVTVPTSLAVFLDDIGWMEGKDDRVSNGPSRTGIPRRHVLADYVALNEIGKACGIRIGAGICLGEWDINNIMRRVPESSQYGEKWDSSKYLRVKEAEEMRDYLNSAEYIDIGVHGLLHETWKNGEYIEGQEFFHPADDKKFGRPIILQSEEYIRSHLDAFFEIYETWGFKQKLENFASPGGAYESYKDDTFARILRSYGVRYWNNNRIPVSAVREGVFIHAKAYNLCSWEVYDLDPDYLPDAKVEESGIVGGHWPNMLRFNPEHNLDWVQNWVRYFERQYDIFGMMRGVDNAFAHHQQLYHFHTDVRQVGDSVVLDFTEADAMMPKDLPQDAYVSIRNGEKAPVAEGATLTEYDRRREFTTYRVIRNGNPIVKLS